MVKTISLDNSEQSIHWMMEILQNIDAGLVVLDRDYRVQLWNGFMENSSGLSPDLIKNKLVFDFFPEIPQNWFKQKSDPVFQLNIRAFTSWQQRPFLFKFKNHHPITARTPLMYQNTTFIPLKSYTGEVEHMAIIVYDATEEALNKNSQNLSKPKKSA